MALLPQDPKKQKQFLLGLLPIALAVGYFYMVHTPRSEELEQMETRVERLARNNDAMRVIVARFGADLPRRLAIYQEHVRMLEQLIPRREDVPRLIYQITERAMETGVDLALIRPGAEQPGDFYSQQTFELHVLGHYHDVAEYLTAIGSLGRIVRPYDMVLKVEQGPQSDNSDKAPVLRAGFRIEVYVMPDLTGPETERTHAST
jgi:type IV pilus assembly protein PilO